MQNSSWPSSDALFGKRRGAVFAAIGIIFYTLLVGADAAVVRAAVMGVTALFARHFGRTQDGLNTLFGVAALMNLYHPYYLQDVGFQLSFFATLGLILYARSFTETVRDLIYKSMPLRTARKLTKPFPKNLFPLKRQFSPTFAKKSMKPISDFLLLTFAAQITTLPIMAYHFNRLSLVSFIANPFILPAQPAVMILGGLATILGMIFQPIGQLVAFIAWPFMAYTIRMVELFAGLPGAAVSVDFPIWEVILWYVALLGLTFGWVPLKDFFVSLKTRLPKIPVWAALATLTLLVILVWRAVLSLPDGKLHITFLDVGTSDAILIETPSGDTVLVNGGESLSQLSSSTRTATSPLQPQTGLAHRRIHAGTSGRGPATLDGSLSARAGAVGRERGSLLPGAHAQRLADQPPGPRDTSRKGSGA